MINKSLVKYQTLLDFLQKSKGVSVLFMVCLVALQSISIASSNTSESASVNLSSDILMKAASFEYDGLANKLMASGNVVVTQKDIKIVGDHAAFDKTKNSVDMVGNIVLTKGKMKLECNKLKTLNDDYKIFAYKNIKFFYEKITGSCEKAEFDVNTQLVKLEGNAKANQGNNELTGQIIRIDLVAKKIQTQGKARINLNDIDESE